MKISLILIICLIYEIECTSNDNLKRYLDKQAKIVNETLNKHITNRKNFYSVKFNYTSKMRVIGNYSEGEIFTIFNNVYILLDQDLYRISHTNYSRIVNNFPSQEKIFILRTTEYKNMGIISCATSSGLIHIFGYSNSTGEFFKIQNIMHSNVSDIIFFENDHRLYMVVSNYRREHLASTVIYNFIETHFDEVEKILIESAKKLHSFSSNGSQIIMILRDLKLSTVIYKLENDQLHKIQKIDSYNPIQVLSYFYMGKRYVLIFNRNNKTKLYTWSGSELLFREEITFDNLTEENHIVYSKNNPFLLSTKNNEVLSEVLIYSLANDQLKLIYNSTFVEDVTKIWACKVIAPNNFTNNVFTLGPSINNSAIISTFVIVIETQLSGQNIIEENTLSTCFLNLEKTIYKIRNQTALVENKGQNRLRQAEGKEQKDVIDDYKQLEETYSNIKSAVDTYISNSKFLIMNETVIEKPLKANKATVNVLNFEKLNNRQWDTDRWLLYSIPQNISGFVKINFTQITHLHTNDSLFEDLLLTNGKQTITGPVTVKNLSCIRFKSEFINAINMKNLYLKSNPTTIRGVKQYPQLNVKYLDTETINGMNKSQILKLLTDPQMEKHDFGGDLVEIENLWVEYINGVNFEEFKNTVFRVGSDSIIDGSLIFTNLEAKNMSFRTLAGKSSVLTTSTDQRIKSSITVPKIFAKNVNVKIINGLDFNKSVASFDTDLIEGPVSIKDVKVNNNLEMKGKVDKRYLRMQKDHIVGTNESDLLQRYNANVKIKGNLFLKNLNIDHFAKIWISNKEFVSKFDDYWTKSSQQIIPIRFEAQNGISTPHILANTVNGINIDDYMLVSSEQNKPSRFYFEDVTVQGNVVLKPNEQHSPSLRKIQKESVKVNGTFNIKGHKIYKNILKVDHLKIKQLNNVNLTELDNYDDLVDITDAENIPHLIVQGDLYFENLSTTIFNNVNLNEILTKTLYINKPQNVGKLQFENITVKNLYVNQLNGRRMEEISSNMNKTKFFDSIENLFINGEVNIHKVSNLSTINDLSVNHLLREGRKKFHNNTVFGHVKFLGHVKVKNFYVTTVNNISLPDLSVRILDKLWNQTIKESYQFKKLKTENLVAEKINNFNVGTLVDITSKNPQNLILPNGLRILEPVKIQNLNTKLKCDLHEALKNLRNPPTQFWENLIITGNVTFMDKDSKISNIFDKAVTSNSDHVIYGKTKFDNHICANNINTLKKINNIDLMEIIQDAFINTPDMEQVITGRKTFTRLEVNDLTNLENMNVPEVNGMEIANIDENLLTNSSITDAPITGKKVFFGGLQTKYLETEHISGLKPDDLVSFTNSTRVAYAIFESMQVSENFNVKLINNMPFDVFLNERLLKVAPKQIVTGDYFFNNIIIRENASTPQINDVKLDDVVFDSDTQEIVSIKRFTEDLNILGYATVGVLNGFKLSEVYEKAVMKNENTVFNGTLTILAPAVLNGNIRTNYINNFPVSQMVDINTNQSLSLEFQQIQEITKQIADFVNKYLNSTIKLESEYLYLEKSSDLQITVPNTLSAQILTTKNDVLIHIESEEDGNFCGLPKNCKCPTQQTMQISSEHSVSSFINKATQRIYSYYDDDIIVHLITNSISTSSFCRTNKTKVINEVSSLTWNTIPNESRKGAFFMHQTFFAGYISGVEFFTAYGSTYVIIAFYYDPVLDTHNLDCVVLKFNEDKTKLNEIQRIPSQATKTLSLIHTAQGIILILGSEETAEMNTTTNIFRLNRYSQKFELLREVPIFDNLFAVGVVLEMDSLIILANRHSVLYILKYQAQYDNYYFYQSFQLDYPVSSVSVFYAEGFGISDAYLTVVTKNNNYFIYSFRFIEGWKLESMGAIDGIQGLIPFKLNKKSYLFASSSKLSSLLTFVEHGSD